MPVVAGCLVASEVAGIAWGVPHANNQECARCPALHGKLKLVAGAAIMLLLKYAHTSSLRGERRMTRRYRVAFLTAFIGVAAANASAQQSPGFLELERAAAGDVRYEVTVTTAQKPYANIEPSVAVDFSIIGSKPGAAAIRQKFQGPMAFGETKSFPAIYGENVGIACRITLETGSKDGWNPASVEVKYYYLNELKNTATFSNKGSGLGWIDQEGCGQDLAPNFNLALGGTAEQSTTFQDGVAARAIDGNTDGLWGNKSVTHTNNVAGSSWQVTLRQRGLIGLIKLWNRTDACCMDRLTNFRLSVLDLNEKGEWTTQWTADLWKNAPFGPDTSSQGALRDGYDVYLPEGVVGSRVKIELLKDGSVGADNFLSLAEVQIFGKPVSGPAAGACPKPPVYFADVLEEACNPNSPQRSATTTLTPTAIVSIVPIEDDRARLVNIDVSGNVQDRKSVV